MASIKQKIQKNIPLSKYSTFKIGGPAKYFCVVENIEELKEILKLVQDKKIKCFVLGWGSNVIFSDDGFDGMIIKLQISNIEFKNSSKIIVESGLSLAKFVNESVKKDFTGLEWAIGIPGTVGGAICNNSGAFGKSISDNLEKVDILFYDNQSENIQIKKMVKKECEFSYRGSIFRREKKYVIAGATFKLKKGNHENSRKKMLEYVMKRNKNQPIGYPGVGSIFKNPTVDKSHFERLSKEYPKIKEISKNNIIPAGWLIEEMGLKGKRIGGAEISKKHCNFIVNKSNAKADDVIILISLIKQKIRDKFGIQLEQEVEYVGL